MASAKTSAVNVLPTPGGPPRSTQAPAPLALDDVLEADAALADEHVHQVLGDGRQDQLPPEVLVEGVVLQVHDVDPEPLVLVQVVDGAERVNRDLGGMSHDLVAPTPWATVIFVVVVYVVAAVPPDGNWLLLVPEAGVEIATLPAGAFLAALVHHVDDDLGRDPFPHQGDPGAVITASLLHGHTKALGRVLDAHAGEDLVVPLLGGQVVSPEVFGLGHEAGVAQRSHHRPPVHVVVLEPEGRGLPLAQEEVHAVDFHMCGVIVVP